MLPQSHMEIPGTLADRNVSTTFPTWFRIHTLALCAQIIPDHPKLQGIRLGFTDALSMGWHCSPEGWRVGSECRAATSGDFAGCPVCDVAPIEAGEATWRKSRSAARA